MIEVLYIMTTVIISSTEDEAGTNIKKALLKNSSWEVYDQLFENPVYKSNEFNDLFLLTINDRTIRHEHIEEEIKDNIGIIPSKAIYISRHRSKSGEPTLTTHPIGNFASADFGGKEKTLTPSLPHLMTALLRTIDNNKKNSDLTYNVCYEVTHHGPYLSIPTLFVEVGSSIDEWVKPEPAGLIADSLLSVLQNYDEIIKQKKDYPILVGYGGGHYAPRFTDVALEKKVAFGHMIPSYHINQDAITLDILQKAIEASEPCFGVYIHRKSLKKSQVTHCKEMCEALNIPVVSSKDFTDIA